MTGARPQKGGARRAGRSALAAGALAAGALAAAGCGGDSPEPEDVASGVAQANAAIVSGDVVQGADAYEEALATVEELDDAEAAEVLTRALEPARDAAARLAAAQATLSEAEQKIGATDRYAPELALTAKDLDGSGEDLRNAGSRLRLASRELTTVVEAEVAEELRSQEAELARAAERLRADLRAAAARAHAVAQPHPYGPLRPDGIGPVDFGDPAAVAKRAFGFPDRDQEVGFGVGPAPRLDWIYRSEPGFRLIFNAGLGTVAGYSCDRGCGLETAVGIRVGDPMAKVRRAHGSELRDYPIGLGSVFVSARRPGSFPALVFSPGFESDRLISISAFETLAGPAGD